MQKIPWIGACVFVVAAIVNAWMIGDLVETNRDGSWTTFPELDVILATSILAGCCLLSAWLVFGATHLAIRGTIVALSVAVLGFEYHMLWGADSHNVNVRPDILTAFLVVAMILPRARGWRVLKPDRLVIPVSTHGSRQFSLLQLLIATCLVAIGCSVFRYFWRHTSSPEILVINLLLALSLITLSLYGTLACARPALGILVAIVLYAATTALFCIGYCWLKQLPLAVLPHDYIARSMLLELTLTILPLIVLRGNGFRLTGTRSPADAEQRG